MFLGGICFDLWKLMIGTCSEGPIYRTKGSITRLAAINGCHELARGKGFNPIRTFGVFSRQFDMGNGLRGVPKSSNQQFEVSKWSNAFGI